MTILVVDDEADICESIRIYLEANGYKIDIAKNGNEAWQKINANKPELVLTDLIMPGMDGLQLCNKIKNKDNTADIPIIVLTARDEEVDVVLGLEYGADDYVTKPFSLRELLARVRAVLRRTSLSERNRASRLIYGKIVVNCLTREVSWSGKKVTLTNKEFDLLRLFVTHPEEIFSRNEIIDRVWGKDYVGDARVVDLQIKNLRKKIQSVAADQGGSHDAIKCIRNKGYILSFSKE